MREGKGMNTLASPDRRSSHSCGSQSFPNSRSVRTCPAIPLRRQVKLFIMRILAGLLLCSTLAAAVPEPQGGGLFRVCALLCWCSSIVT